MAREISTVIPVFLDSGLPFEVFAQAVNYVFEQSVLPAEIIISDDSTSRIIENWLEVTDFDPKVKIVYVRNTGKKGVSGNSNFGAMQVTGEYIHFLHYDDFIINRFAYEEALRKLSSGDKSWLLFGSESNGIATIPDLDNLNLFGINSVGGPSAVFIKSNAFDYFDEELSMLMDIEFYKRTLSKYGPPVVLRNVYLKFGFGDWQIKNNIGLRAIQNELEYLSFSGAISNKDFSHLMGFNGLFDFKILGLKIMKATSKVSTMEYLRFRLIICFQWGKFRLSQIFFRFKL